MIPIFVINNMFKSYLSSCCRTITIASILVTPITNFTISMKMQAVVYRPEQVICTDNINSSDYVQTPTGLVSLTSFCEIQIRPPVQPSPVQEEAWGNPYWSYNRICRDRSTSTICVTPESAIHLRWQIPQPLVINH
jgi:hypothetical protein